jgi:hypothetical protein
VGGDGGGGEEDEAAKRPESGCSSAMASSVRGWQRTWSLTVSTVLHCFIKEIWFLGGAFVPPTLNVASPLGLGGGQPRAELGGGLQDALMKCNERQCLFAHPLSSKAKCLTGLPHLLDGDFLTHSDIPKANLVLHVVVGVSLRLGKR